MQNKKPKDLVRVTTADGKYTVVVDSTGKLSALRYGEPWRDCTGDKLILALASNLETCREQIAHLLKCCDFTADGKPVVRGSTLVLMPNNDPSRELMKLKVPDVVNYCWFETKEDEQAALAKKAAQQ